MDVDIDIENFSGAGCCLYAQIQITNYDNVIHCRAQFEFDLPSTVVEKRIKKFVAKYRSCENVICKFV